MALNVVKHPLVQHKLTLMRDKNTGPKDFRQLLTEITMLMLYDVTKDLSLEEIIVETPLVKTKGTLIKGKKICLIPILRAGLGMVEASLIIMPNVKVGYLGMRRNEQTFEPVEYYENIPSDINERSAIILDPMLATGGSAAAAVKILMDKGVECIKFLGLVAAPKGVEALLAVKPDIDIYVASLDEKLNDRAYIIPGLGDAGDRLYGTL